MKTAPGSVYLAASSAHETLKSMCARALASVERRSAPRVAVTFAAAGGPSAERMMTSLGAYFPGASMQRFVVEGERVNAPVPPAQARAIVEEADIVFVSGGDPVHGARLLVDAGADGWLREARARGAACIGVSAGAMMLCAWWASWPDAPPHDAAHDGGELVSCTRVVPDLVVDCHAEEDEWSELHLVRAMLRDRIGFAHDLPRLLGLPTGAGLVVAPDGALESIGSAPFQL
jgi:cyanophycinase-like exopeptidase